MSRSQNDATQALPAPGTDSSAKKVVLTVPAALKGLELHIEHENGNVYGGLYKKNPEKKYFNTMAAFAIAEFRAVRVEFTANEACIWLGRTAFDISQKSADQIIANFGFRCVDKRKAEANGTCGIQHPTDDQPYDVYTNLIAAALVDRQQVTMVEILSDILKLDISKCTKREQHRIGRSMAQLGWIRQRSPQAHSTTEQKRNWLYVKPQAEGALHPVSEPAENFWANYQDPLWTPMSQALVNALK